jgi:group I intron endonuclease
VTSFVYLLQNAKTGAVYVGKANDVEKRWREHVNAALDGRRWPICRAIRKYGADSFTHFVVEEWPAETEALDAERELIAYLRWLGASLYNATDGGEGFVGLERTPEHCRRISEANRRNGAERGAKISRRLMGRHPGPRSEETKAKIAAYWAKKRKEKPPKPAREKRSRTPWNKGKKGIYSEETRRKIREAATNISDETRRRQSEAQRLRFARAKERSTAEEESRSPLDIA